MGFLGTFLKRLPAPSDRTMLNQGDEAPNFEVSDHKGETVRLGDFAGRRVVLWFYPKADTPG
jgi:peroxiredoxin Q/BCP